MAVKVIEYGKRRVTCPGCESLLEYNKEDTESVRTGMNEYEKVVVCPVCGMGICVTERK